MCTCGDDARDVAGSYEQVVYGVDQVFDVDSSHVVIVPVCSATAALYRHQVVIPAQHTQGRMSTE